MPVPATLGRGSVHGGISRKTHCFMRGRGGGPGHTYGFPPLMGLRREGSEPGRWGRGLPGSSPVCPLGGQLAWVEEGEGKGERAG